MVKISGGYAKIKKWVTDRLHTDHQVASAESASFKDVNIAINEAYKQAADIILRIKATNSFIGIDAGKVTTGDYNNFVGYQAGFNNSSGYYNNFVGYRAGYSNRTAHYNNFVGYQAGFNNSSGYYNNFVGAQAGYNNSIGYYNNFVGFRAGYSNSTGYYNNFVGFHAGYFNSTGHYNNFVGYRAGYSNSIGHYNNFVGYQAGYYETTSNKLFIDNQARANEADARIKALIYGVFDAAIANQLVRLNAILELTTIKNGSTQVNAGAAINEVWKTNGHATLPNNVLMIGV